MRAARSPSVDARPSSFEGSNVAKKHKKTIVFQSKWDAARDTLTETTREGARKLDIDRIIAAAGELIVAHETDNDPEFARALDMIVRYGFDAGRDL